MTRLALASVIAAPVLLVTSIHSVAARLDAATRTQCISRDWPAHQHAAHSEFCRTYLTTLY